MSDTRARPRRRGWGVRLLEVLLGLVVGLLAAVVHLVHVRVGDVRLPWGLVLGLATSWAVAAAASRLDRRGAACVTLGWAAAVLLQQSVPGSYLVTSDLWGWSFMLGGLLGLALLTWREGRVPPG